MKPPLSNHYCSTINIADESVCEMPVSKVTKWIDSNDFHLNGKSSSFHSIATSQMFAYIRKDGKINKELSSESLADYIDDLQMDKQLDSVCNNSCNEANRNDNSLLSLYVDESNLNQNAHLTRTSSCEINPYCDENTAFNNLSHLTHSHNSLPDYIEESHCGYNRGEKQLHESSFVNSGPLTSQRHLDKSYISNDSSYANSLPVLMPYVDNPVLAKSFNLSQSSNNKITDKTQMVTNSTELNSSDHHNQQLTDDNVDSGLTSDYYRQDTDSGLNSGSVTDALQNSGSYESLSHSSKQVNSKIASSDSSLCSNHSGTNTSVNTSTSVVQISSLGYFELPADKYTYCGSRTSSKRSFFSELDFNSHLCDITDTSNTNRCFTNDRSDVDLGYVHLPLSSENLKQNQMKDITETRIENITLNDYILSIENVV